MQTFYKIILIFFCVSVIIGFYVFTDSQTKLHKTILSEQQKIRDSLSKKISILAVESDSLRNEINGLQTELSQQIKSFKNDLYKIKIVTIPNVNYSTVSDTFLLKRLLSGF